MKYCPWCGNTIEGDDAKFCFRCGHDLPADGEPVSTDAVIPDGAYAGHAARGKKKKLTTYVIVAVLLIAGVSGVAVAAVGGKVAMDIDYRENYFVFENESVGLFSGFTWTVTEENGTVIGTLDVNDKGSVEWTPPEEHGVYIVILTARSYLGMEQTVSEDLVDDGTRTTGVTWKYGGETEYSVEYSINVSDYFDYRTYRFTSSLENGYKGYRSPGQYLTSSVLTEYMTTDTENDMFEKLVEDLYEQMRTNMTASEYDTDEEVVNYLMSFVYNLDNGSPYKYDDRTYNASEYWAFPVQTLYNKGGDCEDLAMLLMALCIEFFAYAVTIDETSGLTGDIDMGIALYWADEKGTESTGHAMAAVYLKDGITTSAGLDVIGVKQNTTLSGYNVTVDDATKTYYVCETTSTHKWYAGWIGSNYDTVDPAGDTGKFVTVN